MNDSVINRIVEEALREDLGMGDITTDSIVAPEQQGEAALLVKEGGVIAGLEIAAYVFYCVDSNWEMSFLKNEGDVVESGTVIANLKGSLASILKAERTALNILQRMSGIATLTRNFVNAVEGTSAKITDTRKTAPGLRLLDKMAVQIGGGINHRFGLDDMVLIKDNHIEAAGGIANAIERCLTELTRRELNIKVEVETRTLEEVKMALQFKGIHRIMLDNFSLEEMWKAVQLINHAVEVEASGKVNLETVRAVAETGVDFISVGMLTHSPKA
ncbi:MAG: carboxylating nicotinate-nucleotide diphosphorylase, partial [Ignavibacteriales bacterium]|nr:carboxylating nicotinate-nucleotide diphosphorylase [Ignavibacteriales bacterium]